MPKPVFWGALLALTANFFWATNAIVGKKVIMSLPAFTLAQFRWLMALVLLAPFGIPHIIRQWAWYRVHCKLLIGLSLLSVTLYNTLQYWALEYTDPVTVGAISALMPLSIAVVSGLLGGSKQTGLQWLTTAVAVFGALLVVTNGQFEQFSRQSGMGWGSLLMVLAILCWAFYSVFFAKIPHDDIKLIGLLTFFVAVGSIFIIPFWLVDILTTNTFIPAKTHWRAIFFVALFPSIVSYFCWNYAVRLSGATIAGLMITTAPLFNALLAMIYLDAHISYLQWLGIAVVMIGVAATLMLTNKAG